MLKLTPKAIILLTGLVAGCSEGGGLPPELEHFDPKDARARERSGTISGDDGIVLFSSRRREEANATSGALGVNSFLWRGTLETLDFLPLASADPVGGVIITDWYQSQNAPGERLKINVLIKDKSLRADTLKLSLFRQIRSGDDWVNVEADKDTVAALEDKILTRARELRIEQGDL